MSRQWKSMAAVLVGAACVTAANAAPVQRIADFRSGYLLGQSTAGGPITTAAPASGNTPKKDARRYKIYSWNRYLGQVNGTTPTAFGAPCEDTLFVKFAPSRDQAQFKNGVIAVSGQWNALPRVPRLDKRVNPAYKKSVVTILQRAGIKKPTVLVSQIMRVDLEGDGTDEVLITATNHRGLSQPANAGTPGGINPNSRAGEYSMVFLRKVIKGKVQTIMLQGEAHAKSTQFSAPIIYTLDGVFDLNGDGKMEIVLGGQYYEGDWTSVFDVRGNKVVTLAESGCGA